MNKPNIFVHMVGWGYASGMILALLYFAALSNDLSNAINVLFDLDTWFIAFGFGGAIGTILGLLNAVFLGVLLRRLPEPFTRETMKASRYGVYYLTSILTFVGMGLISWIWMSKVEAGNNLYFALFPSIIASIAATYAAHRYLFRLRLYYEELGREKRKAKPRENISHLTDGASSDTDKWILLEAENDAMQNQEG